MGLAVSIGTASAEDLFKGPARITATQGCKTAGTWNPVNETFSGLFYRPESTSKLRNQTLGFYNRYRSQTFSILGTAFTNMYKPVTATQLHMPMDDYPAYAKITRITPNSLYPTTQTLTIYGDIKGWDGQPTCIASFRMDTVRVAAATTPPSWLPVDSLEHPADLYVDRANGRFYANGKQYQTLIDLQASLASTVADANHWSFPWIDSTVTVMAEFYTASSTKKQSVIQLDNGAENSRIGLIRATANYLGAEVITGGVTYMGVTTQTVGAGQTVRLAANFNTNASGVSQDGTATKPDGSVYLPAVGTFRVGNNSVGSQALAGQLWKLAAWKNPVAATDLPKLSRPAWMVWGEGDSYTGGAGGVSILESLARLSTRAVANKGWGGSTLDSQRIRVSTEVASYPGVPFVHWDGDPNGYNADIQVDLANYAAIVAALGHSKYVIVAPLPRGGQAAALRQRSRDLTTALLAAYPGHVVDALPLLKAMGDGSAGDNADIAANVVPRSLLQDGVHLKKVPMDAIATTKVRPILEAWVTPE